jgi:hypothetical protein
MSNRSKASNLIEATDDLRMALRCIRELAKQRRVGKGVWEAAWDWQDEAYKRWCKELSEMGHVSSIATARCDHLKTYDRKSVAIPGGRSGLQRALSSSMGT